MADCTVGDRAGHHHTAPLAQVARSCGSRVQRPSSTCPVAQPMSGSSGAPSPPCPQLLSRHRVGTAAFCSKLPARWSLNEKTETTDHLGCALGDCHTNCQGSCRHSPVCLHHPTQTCPRGDWVERPVTARVGARLMTPGCFSCSLLQAAWLPGHRMRALQGTVILAGAVRPGPCGLQGCACRHLMGYALW